MKLEETFGQTKKTLYHFWTILVLIDMISKNLWFHTEFFGAGMKVPWITFGPLYTITGASVGLMYFTDHMLAEEGHFWKRYVYITLQAVLYFCCIGAAIDLGIFLMDKQWYCDLQKETVMKHCEERNEWLLWGVGIWFFIGMPVMYQFN